MDARLSAALPSHPKTKKLIRRVGEAGAWHWVCLILWTRANRPAGDLGGMTAEDIELAVDWRGEPDAFVQALLAVGFVEGEEGSYRLHDWAEHQPWAQGAEMRSHKARWNAIKRHHGEAEADRQVPEYARVRATSIQSDATSTASSTKTDAPSPSPSPYPIHTQDPSLSPPDGGGWMGLGEGVPVVAPVITPATRAAIELRKLGVQTTGMNPELIAAMDEGVTVDALVELAGMHPGKAIAYLCRAARRERAEVAAPVVVGQPRAGPAPAIGKQAQGIKALEDLKNAARNRMAGGGNHGGDAETVHALAGPDASG